MRKLAVLIPALLAAGLGVATPAHAERVCAITETWTFATPIGYTGDAGGVAVTQDYTSTCNSGAYGGRLHGYFYGNCLDGTIGGDINATVVGGLTAVAINSSRPEVGAHVFLGSMCNQTFIGAVGTSVWP